MKKDEVRREKGEGRSEKDQIAGHARFVLLPSSFCLPTSPGGELDSTGQLKCKRRAVVGQQATLKADHPINCQA
jgi:hypothetical protein